MSKMIPKGKTVLSFDPADLTTARLLREIGFTRGEIRDGRITEEEFKGKDLDPEALLSLSRLDNSYEAERFKPRERRLNSGTTYLSPREAQKGRKILKKIGLVQFRDLTSRNSCWRDDLVRLYRDQILKDKRVIQVFEKPVREQALARVSQCAFHIPAPDIMEGIFFPLDYFDNSDPNARAIRNAAASVWELATGIEERNRIGTAVRVGPALYLTAWHNLTGEDGSLKNNRKVLFGAAGLETSVEPSIQDGQTVGVRVPEVPGVFLPIAAEQPKVGDRVYSVGFPNLQDGQPRQRLLSIGTVVRVRGNEIEHTALGFKGSSGGALLNEKGEVVGIEMRGRNRDSMRREFGPGNLSRWHYTGGVAESVVPLRDAILRFNTPQK